MTNTETKTRPSENTITRRKMLQSLPLATVALASSAVAASPGRPASEEPSQALLDLIRDHRHAWEIFGQAVTDADDMHPNYGGPEAEAIRDMRSDAELEARHLLLAFPVTFSSANCLRQATTSSPVSKITACVCSPFSL
jgi:hypothetical protein